MKESCDRDTGTIPAIPSLASSPAAATIGRVRITQLNHVALHVEDVARSCSFYGDVLGLAPIPRPAFTFPGAWFRLGRDQELHLIGDRRDPVHSHNRGNHLALRVDSIIDAEQHLSSRGVEYVGPKQRPDGAWQIFLVDPDGHYVELCELSA
jgi:lactoylglutathione lyase